jgi:tricorn protease-like protein
MQNINLKNILPQNYQQFLVGKENLEFSIFEEEANFKIYNLAELSETISIDGKSYATIHQIQGFVASLQEILGEDVEISEDLSFSKMFNFLCIGEENGRLLLLDDRDKNTLWIFHPDGGDVEKMDKNLSDILNE